MTTLSVEHMPASPFRGEFGATGASNAGIEAGALGVCVWVTPVVSSSTLGVACLARYSVPTLISRWVKNPGSYSLSCDATSM